MVENKKFSGPRKSYFTLAFVVLSVASAIGIFLYYKSKNDTLNDKPSSQLTCWFFDRYEHNGYDRFEAVEKVLNQLGYRMVNGSKERWDLLWSAETPFDHHPDRIANYEPHQRINHFDGISFLTNKLYLGLSTQSKYVPISFEFPRLKNEFLYFQKQNTRTKFVLKNFNGGDVRIAQFKDMNFNLESDL